MNVKDMVKVLRGIKYNKMNCAVFASNAIIDANNLFNCVIFASNARSAGLWDAGVCLSCLSCNMRAKEIGNLYILKFVSDGCEFIYFKCQDSNLRNWCQ